MNAESPLYSPHWYRIGPLHPRLQPGTRIQQQQLRGEQWFIFSHPISGQHHRLNRRAYALISRLDGGYSLDRLWSGLQHMHPDDAPTQDEVIHLLAQLMDAGLVLFDKLPDWPVLQQHQHAQQEREQRTRLNPFAFRLRLFNPGVLLERFSSLHPILFHPFFLLLGISFVGSALLYALFEWPSIRAYATLHLLTPRYLLLAWLLYPCMKALHEFGHAFAVRHWGGTVTEAGLGFFLLVPAPYIDATAATAFSSKWQRACVSSAGIAVELTLAAMALGIWSTAEPGMIRDAAFVIMAIGGLSTVLFNGNPLLRFDGYYILCDVIELPNLATRSQRWWTEWIKHLFSHASSQSRDTAQGTERVWLALYAPAAWGYRLLISIVIVQWIATKSIVVGLLALCWLGFTLLVQPLWNWLCLLWMPLHPRAQRWQPFVFTVVLILALGTGLFWLPFPASTVAAGVLWLPEQSQVRTGSDDGQVVHILARDGQRVRKGQALIDVDDPNMQAEKKRLQAQLQAADAEQFNGWLNQSRQGKNGLGQSERLQTDLVQLEQRLQALTLRAEVDGTFVLPHPEDMQDRYLPKGALIAYVLAPEATTVRAVVSQDDIGRIRRGVQRVLVRLAEEPDREYEGQVQRIEPAATTHLPHAVLGDKGGGTLVTDPADKEGLTTLEPVFLVDIQLPQHKLVRAGGRGLVRFEHPAQPLAQRFAWRFRQVFLRVFAANG